MENMDKGLSGTKISADKSAENTPNATKLICLKLSAQTQELGFWWKKASLDVRSQCPKSRKVDSLDNHFSSISHNKVE